jgi:hypothetical protein
LGGLSATVVEPLASWAVSLDHGDHGFELDFEALGPPAELAAGEPVAAAGGLEGYEHACAVRGRLRTGGRTREIRCLGQRGHIWGEVDWSRIESVRNVAAWPHEGPALALTAVRPAGAGDHEAEPVWAALLDEHGARTVADPRLSTTYDSEGRQRRAGVELWMSPDDAYPHHGSGQIVCGSTLDLGQLRLDCAFFRWHLDGHAGTGRYDVLRRA